MKNNLSNIDLTGSKRSSANLLSKMDETLNEMEQDLYPTSPKSVSYRLSLLSQESLNSQNALKQSIAPMDIRTSPMMDIGGIITDKPLPAISGLKRSSNGSRLSLLPERPLSPNSDHLRMARSSKLNDWSLITTESGSEISDHLSQKSPKPFKVLGVDSLNSHPSQKQLFIDPTALEVDTTFKSDSISKMLSRNFSKKNSVDSEISPIPENIPSSSKALKTLGVDIALSPPSKRNSISRNLLNMLTSSPGLKRLSPTQSSGSSLNKMPVDEALAQEPAILTMETSFIPFRRSSLAKAEALSKKSSGNLVYEGAVQEPTPSSSDIEEGINFKIPGPIPRRKSSTHMAKGVTVSQTNDMRKFVSGYLQKRSVPADNVQNSFFVLTVEGLFEFNGHEEYQKSVSLMKIDKFTILTVPDPNRFLICISNGNNQSYLICPGKSDMDIWIRGFGNAISLDKYSKMPLPTSPEGYDGTQLFNGEIATLDRLVSGLAPPSSSQFLNLENDSAHFSPSIVSALSILKCLK